MTYIHNARKRQLSFNIEKEDFRRLTSQSCTYCGIVPSKIHTSGTFLGSYTYNGLDRVDNEKGYELDNVTPCCETCNRAKLVMTREEFLNWVKQVYNHSFLDIKRENNR